MKTALWWIGLPVRLVLASLMFVVMSLMMPNNIDEVRETFLKMVKGDPN